MENINHFVIVLVSNVPYSPLMVSRKIAHLIINMNSLISHAPVGRNGGEIPKNKIVFTVFTICFGFRSINVRLAAFIVVVATLGVCFSDSANAGSLFDGDDLSAWESSNSPWITYNGVFKNTGGGGDNDYITTKSTFPKGGFNFEVRMKVVSYSNTHPRPRIHLMGNNLFVGNEGFTKQIEVYGSSVSNVVQHSDDSYATGEWHIYRLEVGEDLGMKLYRDGVLTHTAQLNAFYPVRIKIRAGDGWSQGKLEVSSVSYSTLEDPDFDGLSDAEEDRLGTDPDIADTDGDGFLDGFEAATGKDPKSEASNPSSLSSIDKAVEFKFSAKIGATYKIEVTEDLVNWETIENNILGNGREIRRLYSVSGTETRIYRATSSPE